MKFSLDLATVLLLFNTSLVVGAISCLHALFYSPGNRGLGILAASFLSLSCGSAIAGLGETGLLPLHLWAYSNVFLGFFGYAFMWLGIRNLSGRTSDRAVVFALFIPAVWIVVALITDFPVDNMMRATAFHVTAIGYLAFSVADVLLDHRREPLPSRLLLAAFLLGSCLGFVWSLAGILAPGSYGPSISTAFFLQILVNFGIAMSSITLGKERVETQLRHAALTDTLTNVGNRRWFFSQLPAQPMPGSAIIAMDIDLFKLINDNYGHECGDAVLHGFGQRIKGDLRGDDVFARMGGEEFCLYLPETSADAAMVLADRLRTTVSRTPFPACDRELSVTISLGIAITCSSDRTWSDVLRRADNALYNAKYCGRNCVRMETLPAARVEMAQSQASPFPRQFDGLAETLSPRNA